MSVKRPPLEIASRTRQRKRLNKEKNRKETAIF